LISRNESEPYSYPLIDKTDSRTNTQGNTDREDREDRIQESLNDSENSTDRIHGYPEIR